MKPRMFRARRNWESSGMVRAIVDAAVVRIMVVQNHAAVGESRYLLNVGGWFGSGGFVWFLGNGCFSRVKLVWVVWEIGFVWCVVAVFWGGCVGFGK